MDQLNLNKTTTPFLGAVVDEVNGPSDDRIRVALNHGHELLTIQEFIEVTKFAMDPIMVNYFWQVVVDGRPSHMTRSTLECLGYEGEYFNQRQLFTRMLKRNNIPYKELKHDDKEVSLYPTIQEEIKVQQPATVVKQKWLVMDPDDLKRAIMKLNTKNGDTIRTYYISLEKLVRLYAEYCLYFNHREAQRKISSLEKLMVDLRLQNEDMKQRMDTVVVQNTELINQNNELLGQNDGLLERVDEVNINLNTIQDRLDVAVEDRAPKVHYNVNRERFILFHKGSNEPYPYYVIRGQQGYCDRTIARHKTKYPNLTIVMDIACQPNPRNLYIRFRDRYVSPKSQEKLKFKIDGNNIDLNNNSEDILINIFNKLNEEKYDV